MPNYIIYSLIMNIILLIFKKNSQNISVLYSFSTQKDFYYYIVFCELADKTIDITNVYIQMKGNKKDSPYFVYALYTNLYVRNLNFQVDNTIDSISNYDNSVVFYLCFCWMSFRNSTILYF